MSERPAEAFWFSDTTVPYHEEGVRTEILVQRILHEEQSRFQKIQVFDTSAFGRVLALDGVIQTTERDEFIYHEMMGLMPCLLSGDAENALIIGGGDGGVLREVLSVKSIRKATVIEIDERVIEVSKRFLPALSNGAFGDPRANVMIGDGLVLTRTYTDAFDVAILDLTDPLPKGPAVSLFQSPFFEDVKTAMKKDGVLILNSGLLSFQAGWVKTLARNLRETFSYIELHTAAVPSYGCGLYSFILASSRSFRDLTLPELERRFDSVEGRNKYFTPETYFASKTIPPFLREVLAE